MTIAHRWPHRADHFPERRERGRSPKLQPVAPWLAQLELLASLPYPVKTLMPSVLHTLRQGIRASFGTYTPLEACSLRSGSIVSEAFARCAMHWLCAARDQAQASQSTEAMVRSDGESRRLFCLRPDYEDSPLYQEIFLSLEARWSMVVPVLDARGAAHGLLYLHRNRVQGAFSDADQALLRHARRALQGLARPDEVGAGEPLVSSALPPSRVRSASLVLDDRGDFTSLGEGAEDLLYCGAAPGPGSTDWSEMNAQALPYHVREMALATLAGHGRGAAPGKRCSVRRPVQGHGGEFRFDVERLHALDGRTRGVLVRLQQLEPRDVTLARELVRWPLSPQEKRLLVASVRAADQYALAEELGITLNTLKGYVKDMVRRTGFASRQAMVTGILAAATSAEVSHRVR